MFVSINLALRNHFHTFIFLNFTFNPTANSRIKGKMILLICIFALFYVTLNCQMAQLIFGDSRLSIICMFLFKNHFYFLPNVHKCLHIESKLKFLVLVKNCPIKLILIHVFNHCLYYCVKVRGKCSTRHYIWGFLPLLLSFTSFFYSFSFEIKAEHRVLKFLCTVELNWENSQFGILEINTRLFNSTFLTFVTFWHNNHRLKCV